MRVRPLFFQISNKSTAGVGCLVAECPVIEGRTSTRNLFWSYFLFHGSSLQRSVLPVPGGGAQVRLQADKASRTIAKIIKALTALDSLLRMPLQINGFPGLAQVQVDFPAPAGAFLFAPAALS